MAILGDLIFTISKMLSLIIDLYTFILVVAVIMSWFRPDPANPIVRLVQQLTDPALNWVRRWLPGFFFRTGVDFSPIILLLILFFVKSFLIKQLYRLAQWLMV